MPNSTILNTIRSQTGLSTRTLAGFVGTHQTVLNHWGHGTRSLPGEALPQLARFYAILSHPIPASNTTFAEEELAELKQLAQRCCLQAKQLQKQLAAMQQCYKQGLALQHLVQTVSTAGHPLTEKQQRWLESQAYGAAKKLTKNSLLQQKKTEIQIALLQQQAALYEAALGEATS